jgi:hypothetical protein
MQTKVLVKSKTTIEPFEQGVIAMEIALSNMPASHNKKTLKHLATNHAIGFSRHLVQRLFHFDSFFFVNF